MWEKGIGRGRSRKFQVTATAAFTFYNSKSLCSREEEEEEDGGRRAMAARRLDKRRFMASVVAPLSDDPPPNLEDPSISKR
jgi:hypothetical protein